MMGGFGEEKIFSSGAKCEGSLQKVHYFSFPLLSCTAQERSKEALGFHVRLRSTFSLLCFACGRVCNCKKDDTTARQNSHHIRSLKHLTQCAHFVASRTSPQTP